MDLRSRNKVQVQAGMSSMTDLVFLLLIFFIIMSLASSRQYKVDLPSSQSVSEKMQDGTIDVVIDAEDNIRIETDEGEPLTFEQAEAQILRYRDELLAGGMEQPKLKVHADKASSFEKFNDIMVIAKLHNLKLVINAK